MSCTGTIHGLVSDIVQLLRELKHDNIIRLQDICLNPRDKSMYLVFDYAEFDLFVCMARG